MGARGEPARVHSDDQGRLTRGGGRYVADLSGDDTLAVGLVRSSVARGRLLDVGLDAVRAAPGIVVAFDGEDLSHLVSDLPVRFGPGRMYEWQLLAREWVSFVGEPVAVVAGSDRSRVEEACELAEVDYEPLAAVTDIVAALADGAPVVRPEIGSNLVFSASNEVGDVEKALAAASVVVDRRFHLGRHSACPLENRAVLAYEEPLTGDLVVSTSTQIPHIVRTAISTVLSRREESVRVLVPDVGGGFGLKCQVAAEECIVAFLAHHLGRRVTWLEDRWENLVASNHAHDEWVRLRVGFSESGAILAVDSEVTVDSGAHSCYPLSYALEPASTTSHLFGCYRIPAARVSSRGIATNKCASGAYRGVGASAAAFAAERLLDEAAARLSLSRIEIRRRNLIGRGDVPYTHPIGGVMDVGDPLGVFDRLLSKISAEEPWFPSLAGLRRDRDRGGHGTTVLGAGLAVITEHSGPGSAVYRKRGVLEVPGYDSARVLLADDGTFVVYISSADAGQRHEAVCRRQVAEELRVDPRVVRVVEGDTASCPKGTGTFASRFAVAQLSAALVASRRMRERLLQAAAACLGCERDEVHTAEGGFENATGASVSLAGLARWLYYPEGPRAGAELEVPVEERGFWDGGPAHPCGALLAVVELDTQSFVAHVRKVWIVEECGRVLDRDAVLGQLLGGTVMGIGDALLEEHVYSEDGEIMTSSFMDYLLPTVSEAPEIEVEILEDESLRTTRSETGSKGVGEAGTIGAVGAIGCALSDALGQLGACLDELPGTPLRLFKAVGAAAGYLEPLGADGLPQLSYEDQPQAAETP